MTDFPSGVPLPPHVNSYGRYGQAYQGRVQYSVSSPAARNWVANSAMYVPISIPFAYPVTRLWWCNGSTLTTSNADCGIYSLDGTKLASCGSTTMTGTSAIQYAVPTTPIILPPGSYYLAFACDNTSNRVSGWGLLAVDTGRGGGLLQQATAFPLPTTWTPVAHDGTMPVPLCGFTRYASGF